MKMHNKRSRSFTLVEMLVVMAIIALLASMVLTVYAKITQTAKVNRCKAEMDNIVISARSYVSSNSDVYSLYDTAIAFSSLELKAEANLDPWRHDYLVDNKAGAKDDSKDFDSVTTPPSGTLESRGIYIPAKNASTKRFIRIYSLGPDGASGGGDDIFKIFSIR